MTTHSSPPAPPNAQSTSTSRALFNPIHMLPTGYTHVQRTGNRGRERGVGWCLEVAYLKFSMQRCFSTYRVASSVRRCVGVVGGSGSMGNNGRRRSMAASCFQLVRCVSKCHSLSLPMDVYVYVCVCVSICVCGC